MTTLPDYDEALDRALHAIVPLDRFENVSIEHASGRVLAEDLSADRDLPPFNRSQMDGYAIRASELKPGAEFKVARSIAAGSPATGVIPAGSCVAIATGAPLPDDLDTVIPHEQSDRADPVRFTVDSVSQGHAVHLRGSDAKKGDALIKKGTALGPQHLGISAAVGKTILRVHARPQAVVLTSGDEVVSAGASPQPHQIRNSNGLMVTDLLSRFGAEPLSTRHLLDDRDVTINAVRTAIAVADVLITVGGVSVGERDHFPAAFDACGVRRALQGASIQPGRPIVVGIADGGTIVVGLPGNPVSALACSCLFIWPIIRAMLARSTGLPWRQVELARDARPNPHRRAFRPAALIDAHRAVVPSWAGSGDMAHTAATHGLIELPIQEGLVETGTKLRFLPWP